MSRLLPIIRREYLERVRSKPFIIGTILGPVLLAGLMIGPALVASKSRGKPLSVAVVDADGRLGAAVERGLGEVEEDGEARFTVVPAGAGGHAEQRERLKDGVLAGRLDGYVYVPPGGLDEAKAEYHGRNVSNLRELRRIDQVIEEAALARRLEAAGVGAERLAEFTRRIDLKTVKLSAGGEREDRGDTFLFAVILLMALYTSVAMWGAALMNGVIEEKANRIVEVIVSSVPTPTLFAGKLLGVGAAGLTQLLAWAGFTVLFGLYSAQAALVGGATLPEVPWHVPVFFVLFFLLGFFLYGVLYAAVGAAVNSQQEAQSLAFPVMLPLILSMVFFPVVVTNPDSGLAVTLSLLPPCTPLLMFLRIAVLTPPAWQIALSVALTVAAIVLLNWGAARVYRVGILLYGKRPTLPEILRWTRS